MELLSALAGFIGQSVEVFFANQFITGKLTGVSSDGGTFTMNVINGSYSGPGTSTIVSLHNVEMIRVLPA
ncbi:MAG: hypothetical protein K0Q73_8978 [Paenibacillus sp.]|nr:hypothetical protein [Paenibacillus sp.]